MTRARHRAILLVAASLLACDGAAPGGGDRADRDDRSPAAPLRVGREVRLAGPGDAVRFGFHDGGDAFIASAPSHDASVADGALHLVPRHLGQAGAAIELETTSAARGDRAIDLTLVGSAINGESGGLEVRRAGITERFESFDGAVEQSWRFERAPAGQGDLVVEVAALGHDYSGTTERGLHFARSGGLGFRYGHATWVAADGSELAIAARYEAGAIRLVVRD